jgi:glycerol-3-phosphate O-acyltransferase
MGAYFVRRGSGNKLYRRVLSRYVQMAVSGGVTQAIFPEGGLSRDGLLREPRIGLLDYMLRDFDPTGKLDLVFVPVGLNYDRVLDDRTLLIGNDPSMQGVTRRGAVGTALKFIGQQIWLMLRRRWYRNGYACVSFGTPLSLRAYLDEREWNLREMDQTRRGERVKQFASALMAEVRSLIPVLPVSLVCHVLLEQPLRAWVAGEITARAMSLMEDLESRGANVYLPRTDYGYAVEAGLRMVRMRRFVTEAGGRLKMVPEEETIVRYYANSIAHLYPGTTMNDELSAAPVLIAQPG